MSNEAPPKVRRIAPRYALSELLTENRQLTPRGSQGETVFLDQPLPVVGQGVVSLELRTSDPFRIILTPTRGSTAGDVIVLEVTADGAAFRDADDDDPSSILAQARDPGCGLNMDRLTSYWLSLDSQNRRLRYGKGYAQAQLTLLQWDYPEGGDEDPEKLPYAWTEKLQFVAVSHTGQGPFEPLVELHPMPVVADIPALIVPSQVITMDQLARGEVTVIENLSDGCNVLYANVAGANIQLDTPDFPDFSEAINYSIMTEGCVCYELLKSKEGEFGPSNPQETYLRITLGENLGDSPGIPFVLEIWPGQHYSPIHDHAGSDAVIKVLHGQIQSRWFAELSPLYRDYYEKFDLVAGQVTWLSPDYYQTHQLFNPAPEGFMCATLQCYRYPDDDREHYEYFDYLTQGQDGQWTIARFYPNSDMDFLTFKRKIKEEWDQVIASAQIGPAE
ncbi:MAG: cysteine dioxygenase family protein [Myxococcales bacterium]|nr:cysteine dioxygenase family protein [Myxococcales bacterium]